MSGFLLGPTLSISEEVCSTLLSGPESTLVHLEYSTPRYLNGKMQGLLTEAPLKYKTCHIQVVLLLLQGRQDLVNTIICPYLVVIQVPFVPWSAESKLEI